MPRSQNVCEMCDAKLGSDRQVRRRVRTRYNLCPTCAAVSDEHIDPTPAFHPGWFRFFDELHLGTIPHHQRICRVVRTGSGGLRMGY